MSNTDTDTAPWFTNIPGKFDEDGEYRFDEPKTWGWVMFNAIPRSEKEGTHGVVFTDVRTPNDHAHAHATMRPDDFMDLLNAGEVIYTGVDRRGWPIWEHIGTEPLR